MSASSHEYSLGMVHVYLFILLGKDLEERERIQHHFLASSWGFVHFIDGAETVKLQLCSVLCSFVLVLCACHPVATLRLVMVCRLLFILNLFAPSPPGNGP